MHINAVTNNQMLKAPAFTSNKYEIAGKQALASALIAGAAGSYLLIHSDNLRGSFVKSINPEKPSYLSQGNAL